MFKLRRNTCDETFVRLTINYELAAFDRYTRDVNQFNFLSAVAGSKRRKGCEHPRNGPCCRRDIFFPSSSATKKRIGKDVTQHLVMMKRSYRGLSAGAMLLRRSNLFCTGAHFDHRRQSTAGFSVQRDRNRVETD